MSKNKVKVSVDWHYNMYYFPLLVVDVVIVSGSESPEDMFPDGEIYMCECEKV